MAQYVNVAQLNGLFKEVYGDDVNNLIPEVGKLVKMVPFVSRDKQEGNKYHQPVILSQEHGVTYAGVSGDVFDLNDSISMTMKDAQVEGSEMLLRSAISYGAAAKASSNTNSFRKATQLLVENMMESITKRLELAILYGGKGLGTADSSVNAGATSTVVTFLTGTWAAGIWAGTESAKIQFYSLPSETLVSSGADSIFTITAVDTDARTLTVSGTATGITALDSALASTGQCSVYFQGAKGNEMAGLDKILTNTGSLFNIDAAAYNLWKANSYSASSAAMTIGKVLSAVAKAVDRGLNEKVEAFFNPRTWANINNDLAALRHFDVSYSKKKLDSGTEAISFYAQNGEIELISHNCVKEGEAFILPTKRVKRLGAQEISFKTPGRGEEIFRQLESKAGFELRVYTSQSVFFETPARGIKITNIVNS